MLRRHAEKSRKLSLHSLAIGRSLEALQQCVEFCSLSLSHAPLIKLKRLARQAFTFPFDNSSGAAHHDAQSMSNDAFLKTACPKCRNAFEFPREGLGELVPCPHCGNEVVLTTAGAAVAPILIEPTGTVLRVEGCSTATVLMCLAVLEFMAAPIALLVGVWPVALALAVSAIFIIALAKLVQCAHESNARLARLEMSLQQAVNSRR